MSDKFKIVKILKKSAIRQPLTINFPTLDNSIKKCASRHVQYFISKGTQKKKKRRRRKRKRKKMNTQKVVQKK